jgi:WD40 repeat protein
VWDTISEEGYSDPAASSPNSTSEVHQYIGHSGGENDEIGAVATFSPDGRYIISSGEYNTVCLWDSQIGKRLHMLEGHAESVNSLAISANLLAISTDGKWIASASFNEKILHIWGVGSREPPNHFQHSSGIVSVAFSPNGRHLLSGSDKLCICDLQTGKISIQLKYPCCQLLHSPPMESALPPALTVTAIAIRTQSDCGMQQTASHLITHL